MFPVASILPPRSYAPARPLHEVYSVLRRLYKHLNINGCGRLYGVRNLTSTAPSLLQTCDRNNVMEQRQRGRRMDILEARIMSVCRKVR